MVKHEKHRNKHGDVCGDGSALNTHVQRINECRGEDDIKSGSYNHSHHSSARSAGSADDVVKAEAEVSEEQARENVDHELSGIR